LHKLHYLQSCHKNFLFVDPSDHGEGKTTKAVRTSLRKLGTSYLDLYLIHWPGVAGLPVYSPDNAVIRSNTWRELVTLHHQGVLRAIGTSNYTVRHLRELTANSHGVIPAVNQVCFVYINLNRN
jgi:diketogulonate reductase-like aldo/keto reductase